MDISASLNSLQSAMSMAILNKSMQRDANALTLVSDMMQTVPQPQLAAKIGSMDIRV